MVPEKEDSQKALVEQVLNNNSVVAHDFDLIRNRLAD